MEIVVERRQLSPTTTIGQLFLDGWFECFTLEDAVRAAGMPKVPSATAIPYGRYLVTVTFSQRFQRPLPLINQVPGFDGIRIHAGNTDKDTSGCLLVGRTKNLVAENIGESRLALDALQPRIEAALMIAPVWMTVRERVPALGLKGTF